MKKRLLSLLLAGLFLLPSLPVLAVQWQEGVQYIPIQPAPPVADGDQVEVVEFFWYGCPHCYRFEPFVKKWLAGKPDNVHFTKIPAPFPGPAQMHAKAYYALQLMGKDLTDPIFKAMHEQHEKLRSRQAFEDFVASQGVDREKFRAAMDSFAVQTRFNRAQALARRYGINSVPSLVVDGRYRSGSGFKSYAEMTEVVDYLVDKVLEERRGGTASGD